MPSAAHQPTCQPQMRPGPNPTADATALAKGWKASACPSEASRKLSPKSRKPTCRRMNTPTMRLSRWMPPTLHLVVQQRLIAHLQARVARQEAAHQHVDHADEDQHREQVREQAVGVADHAQPDPFRPGVRKVAVEQVDQVDEQVEHEAVEDEAVEEAHPRPRPEHGALRQHPHEALAQAGGQPVEPGVGARRPAPHHADHPREPQGGEVQRHERQNEEDEFLRGTQHVAPSSDLPRKGVPPAGDACVPV